MQCRICFTARGFYQLRAITHALERYRRESDSVALFLDDGAFVPSMDDSWSLKEFYRHYKDFCKDGNYTACSNKNFSKRLRTYGFEIWREASGRIVGVTKGS